MIGERMEEYIHSIMTDGVGAALSNRVEDVTKVAGERYRTFIEAQAQGVKNKLWRYFELHMGRLRRVTFQNLQHEFGHEMFSNWGLVGVVVSEMREEDRKAMETKKEFLATEDVEAKKRLIHDLMAMHTDEAMPDIRAANSWLAEGLATYCESTPIGGEPTDYLYECQRMIRENTSLPLEQLTVYKIGSFRGVYHEAMMGAYAQSWGFVRFFMERYHKEFLSYMERVARQEPIGTEDIVWLLEEMGKDARTLEREWEEFIQQFPALEDPLMKELDEIESMRRSLQNFGDV
jgi:hypothetical protein